MSLRDLELALTLRLVDRLTGPAKNTGLVTGKLAKQLKNTQTQLKALNQSAKKLEHLKNLNRKMGQTADESRKAKDRLGELWRSFNEAEKAGRSTKRLQQQIANTRKKIDKLSGSHSNLRDKAAAARAELKKAGVDTRKLAVAQGVLDQRTAALNKRLSQQKQRLAAVNKAGSMLKGVWGKLKKASFFGMAAGGAGIGAGMSFVKTAAEFEKYQTILETVEGSQAKAKTSMDWVSDFAVKTPFELAEVTESFVRLRSYGLDPTNGLLKTLGDTGSAMGKPIMQAVEAIADAVTGENERLKEFGIKASTKKGTTTYSYTDRSGLQRELSVMANDRKAIEQALTQIWSEKYSGAMEKQSKKFSGIVSNISDQWSRFQRMVMDSGPFKRLTEHLQGLLSKLDEMSANGELQKWAEEVGAKAMLAIDGIVGLAKGTWNLIVTIKTALQPLADFLGGWDKLAIGLLSVKVIPIFSIMGKLPGLFTTLATLAKAHPILALITALAAGAMLIIENWEPIKAFFANLWDGLKNMFSTFVTWLTNKVLSPIKTLRNTLGGAWDWVTGGGAKKAAGAAVMGASIATTPAVAAPVVSPFATAPAVAAPIRAAAAQPAQQASQTIIQVNPSPGMNEEQLAQLVAQKVDALDRQRAANKRSRLHDEG